MPSQPTSWGDEFTPGGKQMANTWQGAFPHENLARDGYERTSPIMTFPPNGYGLYDMIGNVLEWTSDWWPSKHEADATKACCIPENPRGGPEVASYDPSSRKSRFRERCSKAARTSARLTIAAATVRRRVTPSRSIPQQAMLGFVVLFGRGTRHERR